MLDISVVSNIMGYNFSSNSMTQKLNLKCVVSETKQSCEKTSVLENFKEFEFSFVPTVNGTYTIFSQHFLASSQFKIQVVPKADEIAVLSTLFSNAVVMKSLTG